MNKLTKVVEQERAKRGNSIKMNNERYSPFKFMSVQRVKAALIR